MGRVIIHFSESDFKLFYTYCSNYYRLHGDTRKNSIQILVELYRHQVIDIQEYTLDNLFTFFYHKKQEFETEYQISPSGKNLLMRARICSDIISFLEDLEKIYLLVRKKGVEANYIFIMGIFSKIVDEIHQMRLDELDEETSGAVDAISTPLHNAIEEKLGPDADVQALLNELVRFVGTFNHLSPETRFTEEIIIIIASSLIKKFGKEADYDEIRLLYNEQRDQSELDDLETVLEGGIHDRNIEGLEFSWDLLLEPLRILHKTLSQRKGSQRISFDVLSALEEPLKINPALTEYSPLTLYQEPYRAMKRRNEENLFLVKVDNRERSKIQLSPATDFILPARSENALYKKYSPLISGIMILVIIILAGIVVSLPSLVAVSGGNMQGPLPVTKINAPSLNKSTVIVDSSQNSPVKTVTTIPTPKPTPQYVTIEPVPREPDTGPKSHQGEWNKLASTPNFLFNPKEYISIFKNNMSYNLENAYKISFDLKNAPMIIHYKVSPKNITDIKWFEPKYNASLGKKIDTAIVNRSDESAWFEIQIFNNDGLYDKGGWGSIYGIPMTQQEIVLRTEDMYHLEFSGQKVNVDLEVLVKKEGNIEDS